MQILMVRTADPDLKLFEERSLNLYTCPDHFISSNILYHDEEFCNPISV
jgi:hypothetical protein